MRRIALGLALVLLSAGPRLAGSVPSSACPGAEVASDRLTATGRVEGFDSAYASFKIGDMGFYLDPRQAAVKEFAEYFTGLREGFRTQVRFRIRSIEKIFPVTTELPDLRGRLKPDVDPAYHIFTYGEGKHLRQFTLFALDPCTNEQIHLFYGPAELSFEPKPDTTTSFSPS